MKGQKMLDTTAKLTDSQQSAKSDENDYATPRVDLCEEVKEAETHIATRDFNQIQGAEDGSLVVHHAKVKGGKRDY